MDALFTTNAKHMPYQTSEWSKTGVLQCIAPLPPPVVPATSSDALAIAPPVVAETAIVPYQPPVGGNGLTVMPLENESARVIVVPLNVVVSSEGCLRKFANRDSAAVVREFSDGIPVDESGSEDEASRGWLPTALTAALIGAERWKSRGANKIRVRIARL